jgi:diguanylate cyclase (GGDEF)-like protein
MSQHNDLFDERMLRDYFYAVSAVALSIVAEMLSVGFTAPNSLHRLINMISCVIGFGLSPLIALLMVNAFGSEHTKLRWPVLLPGLFNLLLVLLSPFYGLIFHISPLNEYGRGPLFRVYVFAYLFAIAIFLVGALRARKIYQSRNRTVLIGLLFITLLGTTIQVLMPQVLLSWSTITIVMILGYTYHVDLLDKHDVVTRLFNRRAYENHLRRLQAEGRGWIILFDIDDFKLVNDSLGHHYGDLCLQTIAGIIRESYSAVGCGYRIGGDEFSVLCTCADEQEILEANSKFVENIRLARNGDTRIPLVSLGHAWYDSSLELNEVVEAADRQLFAYKRGHKLREVHT